MFLAVTTCKDGQRPPRPMVEEQCRFPVEQYVDGRQFRSDALLRATRTVDRERVET
jgi:hypothetical protein